MAFSIFDPENEKVLSMENERQARNARARRLLIQWMEKKGACKDALEWVKQEFDRDTSLKDLYLRCDSPPWYSWLDLHVGVPVEHLESPVTPWNIMGPILRTAIGDAPAESEAVPTGWLVYKTLDTRVPVTDKLEIQLKRVFSDFPFTLSDESIIRLETLRAISLYKDRDYMSLSALILAIQENGTITLYKG